MRKRGGKRATRVLNSYGKKIFVNSKRAQVTLFIIAGLALVGIILLFILFREKIVPKQELPPSEDPNLFIQSCLQKEMLDAADKITAQGGTYDLSSNGSLALTLDGQRIAYLCFTTQYYAPCVNQQPMLLEHIKQELHDALAPKVKACFAQLQQTLQEQGYQPKLERNDFSVELAPNKITLRHDASLTINKGTTKEQFDDFHHAVRHSLYDLSVVAQEIASQEAKFCNFETEGFSILYPQFRVTRFRTGSGSIIYTVISSDSGISFKFGVVGCVIPPAY